MCESSAVAMSLRGGRRQVATRSTQTGPWGSRHGAAKVLATMRTTRGIVEGSIAGVDLLRLMAHQVSHHAGNWIRAPIFLSSPRSIEDHDDEMFHVKHCHRRAIRAFYARRH